MKETDVGLTKNKNESNNTTNNLEIDDENGEKGGIYLADIWKLSLETIQTILPICIVLIVFYRFILKSPIENLRQITFGIVLVAIGLIFFIQGLEISLIPLGRSIGLTLPKYGSVSLILVFAFLMGYGATLAEPALTVLALEIEELTAGILTKNVLMNTVAFGVALGIVVGSLKIIYSISFINLIVPYLLIACVLACFAPEYIRGIAFDVATAPTGPVIIPLNFALAFGLATAMGGKDPFLDGFGFVAFASAGPVITVLILGIIVKL